MFFEKKKKKTLKAYWKPNRLIENIENIMANAKNEKNNPIEFCNVCLKKALKSYWKPNRLIENIEQLMENEKNAKKQMFPIKFCNVFCRVLKML